MYEIIHAAKLYTAMLQKSQVSLRYADEPVALLDGVTPSAEPTA